MSREYYLQALIEAFNVKSKILNDNDSVAIEDKFKIGFTYFSLEQPIVYIKEFALLLDKNDKLISDDYLVYCNSKLRLKVKNRGADDTIIPPIIKMQSNDKIDPCATRPTDPEMAVIGAMQQATGAIPFEMKPDMKTLDFDLSRLNPDVDKVIIGVYAIRDLCIGDIDLVTRFYYTHQNPLDTDYMHVLSDKFDNCYAVEICGIYREGQSWNIKPIDKGYNDINQLIEKYK